MQLRSRTKASLASLSVSDTNTSTPIQTKGSIAAIAPRERKTKRTSPSRKRHKLKKLKITGPPFQVASGKNEKPEREDVGIVVSNQLFESLLTGHKEEIKSALALWKEMNSKAPYDSYVELVRLVVLISGANVKVPHNILRKKEALDELCKACLVAEMNQKVHQITICTRLMHRKDRKAIANIFSKCWLQAKQQIISGGAECQIFTKFVLSLCTLTTSKLRSLRRASTIVCLQLITDVSKQYSQIAKKVELLLSTNKTSQTPQTMKLTKSKDIAHNLLISLLNTIYPKRFRDMDAGIRAACSSYFGMWVHEIPSILLSKEYLDHNKWTFFDGNSVVRAESLKSLVSVYTAGRDIPQISAFFSNVKSKLFEVLENDIDANVRIRSSQLLATMCSDDLLEGPDVDRLLLFVFDSNQSVRKEIGSALVDNWKKTHLGQVHSKVRNLLPSMSSAQKNSIEIMSYCDCIIKISALRMNAERNMVSKEVKDRESVIDNVVTLSDIKKKDIQDYVTWLKYTCPPPPEEHFTFSQIDTIIKATKKYLPVLDPWTIADLLEPYLSVDKKSKDNALKKNAFSPMRVTDDQEICLLYIFYSLCGMYISEKAQSQKKYDTAPELVILHLAPKIITKYAHAGNAKSSRVCEELLIMMKDLCFENLSAVEADSAYTPLIQHVKKLLEKTAKSDLVKECAGLFEKLMAAISAQDSNLVSYIFSNAKITQGNPANYTTAKVSSAAREAFDSLMNIFVKSLHSFTEALSSISTTVNNEILDDLRLTLLKICKLLSVYRWCPASDYNVEMHISSDAENMGILFNSVNSLLDHLLAIPSDCAVDERSKYLITSTAVQCLELLGLDSMWELWDSLTDVVRKSSINKREIKEKETSNLKDKLVFLRSCLTPSELGRLPGRFIQKSQQLVKISEAIVIGSECNIPLDLPFRISAFRVLSNLLILMNGDSSLLFTNISYLPPHDVQEKSKDLILRMLNALAFSRLEWYKANIPKKINRSKTPNDSHESTEFCTPEVRHVILKSIADMDRLISYDIFDVSISDIILGYYGVAATEMASLRGCCISIVSPFTTIWDGLAEHCAKKIFGNRFSPLVVGLIQDKSVDKQSSRVFLKVKEFLKKSFEVLLSSFKISFDLYCNNAVTSDLAMVKLSRLICKSIYSWSSVATTKPELSGLRELIIEEISNFVRSGILLMIGLTKVYIANDKNARCALKLSEFNKGWKVWIAILDAAIQVEKVFLGVAGVTGNTEDRQQAPDPVPSWGKFADWLKQNFEDIGVSAEDIKNGEDWRYIRLIEKYQNSRICSNIQNENTSVALYT